ncbi:MAG: nickel pincer cofactor biosynthesis protein LarC [Polyangiaceae bacterium]|nr:nickel pincer cofactor biosynthesis protein LarC [Polyangiaceae bacterium]
MTIASLLDLGVPLSVVETAVAGLGLEGVQVTRRSVWRGAIGATYFEVLVDGPQCERSFAEIDALLAAAPLGLEVRELARRIFRRLGEAEADVHRIPLEAVHFHEVGAVDAIVDIVGAAAALAYLGARVMASPLPLGHGTVRCRHGVLPLPAPATVACLVGVPTYAAGVEAELVTPTGAAILASAAEDFVRWPTFTPERVGWGAGSREIPDRPNVLRVVLGVADVAVESTHVVLEANVDDLTGELAAHAIERLMANGALDAWAAPITMKKGRPALTVAALATTALADAVAAVLLSETSSLGVRRTPITRIERPRRTVTVETGFGNVPVKVSEGPFGPPTIKPEFSACVAAAKEAGVPVREVLAAVLAAARGLT